MSGQTTRERGLSDYEYIQLSWREPNLGRPQKNRKMESKQNQNKVKGGSNLETRKLLAKSRDFKELDKFGTKVYMKRVLTAEQKKVDDALLKKWRELIGEGESRNDLKKVKSQLLLKGEVVHVELEN